MKNLKNDFLTALVLYTIINQKSYMIEYRTLDRTLRS
jgi:hypothetical protein